MMKWKIMQWGGGHVMHTEDYVPTKLGEHETRLTGLEARMAVAESGLKDTKESSRKLRIIPHGHYALLSAPR